VYTGVLFQKFQDLLTYLNNTPSSPGTPITQSKIVSVEYDPGNGTWYAIFAPGI
jgi:hypothetical protein